MPIHTHTQPAYNDSQEAEWVSVPKKSGGGEAGQDFIGACAPKSKNGQEGGYYEGANLSAVFLAARPIPYSGGGNKSAARAMAAILLLLLRPPPVTTSFPAKKRAAKKKMKIKGGGGGRGEFSPLPQHTPPPPPYLFQCSFTSLFFLFAQMCGRLGDRFSPLSLSQARSSICQLWSHCFSGIGGEEEEEEEGLWGAAHTCPISRMLSFEERWEGKKSQLEAEAAHFSFSFFLEVGEQKQKRVGKCMQGGKGQRERKIKAFSSRLRLLAHFSDVG